MNPEIAQELSEMVDVKPKKRRGRPKKVKAKEKVMEEAKSEEVVEAKKDSGEVSLSKVIAALEDLIEAIPALGENKNITVAISKIKLAIQLLKL